MLKIVFFILILPVLAFSKTPVPVPYTNADGTYYEKDYYDKALTNGDVVPPSPGQKADVQGTIVIIKKN